MAPQKFADLGKEARDLLSKNFHFGTVKLETKTKTANGANFTLEGSQSTDSGDVAGSLETKWTIAPYGINVTKKWNTANVLSGTVGVENKLVDGLKVDLDSTFSPVTGKLSTKLKTDYTGCVNLRATADIASSDFTAPSVNASAVFAYNGWHAGYQASYDTAASKLTENNVCLAYKAGDFTIHGAIVDASKCVYTLHHEVNKSLQVAAALKCDTGSETGLTLGGKYALDDTAFVKAKVDNKLNLGLSYSQNMGSGVQATLSGSINGKALDQGGHKIGLHLNFDA
jgi:voltage-dependent anion channel protein 2